MNKITQDMQFRQSLLRYASKYGVTKAAIRYKVNRQYVYRWQRRYDGTWESLKDRSHKPKSHPNQHTDAELKLIRDMRRRNPYTPRHNGKVERSHRKDNEYFYATHKFYSFEDFRKQLAVHSKKYNGFPMRSLGWKSSNEYLNCFISTGEVF